MFMKTLPSLLLPATYASIRSNFVGTLISLNDHGCGCGCTFFLFVFSISHDRIRVTDRCSTRELRPALVRSTVSLAIRARLTCFR